MSQDKKDISSTSLTDNGKDASKEAKEMLESMNEAIVAKWIKNDIKGAIALGRDLIRDAKKDSVLGMAVASSYEVINRNLGYLEKKVPVGTRVGIFCYASNQVGQWDTNSVKGGIAGSEEAVIYVAQILADRGYQVTVLGNPTLNSVDSLSLANPKYLHVVSTPSATPIGQKKPFEVGIAWRRTDFATIKRVCDKVYYWPHDTIQHAININGLDGAFYLTHYHKDMHVKLMPFLDGPNIESDPNDMPKSSENKKVGNKGHPSYPVSDKSPHTAGNESEESSESDDSDDEDGMPSVISGNGIVLSHFKNRKSGNRVNPYSCIYASNYARGLSTLISVWPEVKKVFPQATLDIYYGREVWGQLSVNDMNDLIKKIESYRVLGVNERGKVGHEELAEAFCSTSLWTYPCVTGAETFCITAVKAQAGGCIPVTTRVAALNETVHPLAPTVKDVKIDDNIRDSYLSLLLETMTRIRDSEDDEVIEKERDSYIEFADRFTWDATVDKWMLLMPKPIATTDISHS